MQEFGTNHPKICRFGMRMFWSQRQSRPCQFKRTFCLSPEQVSGSHSLCPTLRPHGLYSPWNSPGQNTGLGNPSLLHWIFPTQGSNPGLPHCRWILYQLSHQGNPLATLKNLFQRESPFFEWDLLAEINFICMAHMYGRWQTSSCPASTLNLVN